MAARVKKRTDTSTNRESDKIIVRLPKGMRAYLAEMAARRGRSMNAEVVTALAAYFAHDGEVDTSTIKSALVDVNQELKAIRDSLDRAISQRVEEALHRLKKDPPA
jgi:plasmid stability protein